jgi:hypothetical protein
MVGLDTWPPAPAAIVKKLGPLLIANQPNGIEGCTVDVAAVRGKGELTLS